MSKLLSTRNGNRKNNQMVTLSTWPKEIFVYCCLMRMVVITVLSIKSTKLYHNTPHNRPGSGLLVASGRGRIRWSVFSGRCLLWISSGRVPGKWRHYPRTPHWEHRASGALIRPACNVGGSWGQRSKRKLIFFIVSKQFKTNKWNPQTI